MLNSLNFVRSHSREVSIAIMICLLASTLPLFDVAQNWKVGYLMLLTSVFARLKSDMLNAPFTNKKRPCKARPLQVACFGDSVVYYYTPQNIIQQW